MDEVFKGLADRKTFSLFFCETTGSVVERAETKLLILDEIC